MNAIMTHTGVNDPFQRYDASRRRSAESAYTRNVQYNGQNQKTVENLEALLTGKRESEIVQPEGQKRQKLGAGQMKQVALPIGKTHEETIDIWKAVRAEAISVPVPTTADYNLAATASAKIMQTEMKIALCKHGNSEVETAHARDQGNTVTVESLELPPGLGQEAFMMQRRYEQAISSYAFQAQLKQQGFEISRSSIDKTA